MTQEIKIAYYRESDWDKLLKSALDKESMHDTWKEWNADFIRAKRKLESQGLVVLAITINIDALNVYCFENQLPNNGKARSKYVAQLGDTGM